MALWRDKLSSSDYKVVDVGKARAIQYWGVTLFLSAGYLLLRDVPWQSDAHFHTLLESIATLLALMVGIVALVRYYSHPVNSYLFVGVGFLGTAFLDGYHTIVTSTWFAAHAVSVPSALIPWSWVASRIFLAVMLYVGLLMTLRERRLGDAGTIDPRWAYWGAGTFTLISFFFFALVPLPQAYWPDLHHMHRPQEFVAALFFLLALVGYLRTGDWRYRSFEHWMVLALIVSVVGQVLFMPSSHELFDANFDMAHFLKKISYIFVLTGLLINMLFLYQRADLTTQLQHEIQVRHEAEQELQQANRQLLAVFEGVDDVIYVADPDSYELLYVNPAFRKQWGEEVLGQKCFTTLQNRTAPCPFCTNEKIFGENLGQSHVWEFQNEVTQRWYRCSDKAIQWVDGRMVRFELASDITEQKELEQQRVHYRENLEHDVRERTAQLSARTEDLEQANKDLESFSYSVSHDLRAPLRAISGFVTILEEDYAPKLDDEGLRVIGVVRENAGKMGSLIDDILLFSRAGRLDLEHANIDMMELVQEVWESFSEERKRGNYQLEMGQLPPVDGDIRAIRQVIQNLLSNAIKFSKARDPAMIRVSGEMEEESVRYTVRDNGVGFKPEYAHKLFSLFQRLHTADEYEGTGVGLAIVKRFIQKHGGVVTVDAELGQGAAFSFTLPRVQIEDES